MFMTVPSFFKITSYILFFLMLFSPFAFTGIKMACLILLILSVIFYSLVFHSKIKMSIEILTWLGLFMAHGIFFLTLGLIYGAKVEYVLKYATIAVIWPFAFLLLFFFDVDEVYILKLYNVIKIATICISLYAIYQVLALFGFVPQMDIYPKETPGGLEVADGNVEMSLPAATTFMFAGPSIITLYLLTKNRKLIPVILLSLIAIVLISRRALLLNIAITPVLCLIISVFFLTKARLKKLLVHITLIYIGAGLTGLLLFIVLANLGVFDYKAFFAMILEGFDFSGKQSIDPGAQIRAQQYMLLMQSWHEKPILGWGYGAVSRYITRSDDYPFIYELSYIALLFQTGIIGLTIYISLIGWIYYKFRQIRSIVSPVLNEYNISILVGLTTFLLANATNPYLYAFDHMWTLFFPLLIINTVMLNKSKV